MKNALRPLFGSIDAFNAPFPSSLKIDAGNIGNNIEALRIAPETKETAAFGEVFRSNALEAARRTQRARHTSLARSRGRL